MHKKISLLGSTGSIGKNALQVIQHLGEGYEIIALAAHSNIELLEEQIHRFKPKIAAVYDPLKGEMLKKRISSCPILVGVEGLKMAASHDEANFVISAISGTAGLIPTVAAIEAGKDVALANKETLVSGGEFVMKLVKEKAIRFLPVDSEHSAIFQCLQGNEPSSIQKLILTASGGPFRLLSEEELKAVTVERALRHPNWDMGPKITIDSSTLMNKGLEVIEAHFLFSIPPDQIDVVIHPQSIIHSMVEYQDGSIMAQMGYPSMITPIQYALTYPERKSGLLKPFDFIRQGKLEFDCPDLKRFRCLKLAYEALKKGGSMPCYMNGANEVLVSRFIQGEISWNKIGEMLETLMEQYLTYSANSISSIESILEVDSKARQDAAKIV